MKLQSKILIIVIPFVLLSLLGLGLWSFGEAKKSIYHGNYHYMNVVLESYTAETLHQNHQLLKDAKMDQVSSYVESYKQDSINKAKSLATVRGGHIFAINKSGKLAFSTQDINSADIESSWNEISKKIVAENSPEILDGYIDKKPYNDIYVAQYFKPWGWVVFYSIPDEEVSVLVNRIRLITLGISVLCALASSFLIFVFCKKYLLIPIAKLDEAAKSIAAHENIENISIFSTDELGRLARSMEIMSKSIDAYKSEQKKIKKALIEKHEELQKSQSELKLHQNSLEQLVDERTIELKKSEKQFRTIIAKSPLPMVITNNNQDMMFFNDKFTELFGYTLADVSTAAKWWEIAYPDENYRTKVQQSWIVAIEEAENNKTDIRMQEWELTIKDRTKRICEFYMVPLEDVSLIIVNDITDRKLNEGKLSLQSEIITQMSEGVSLVGEDGILIYTNPEFEKMFGYGSGEMIGLHVSIVNAPSEKHPEETAKNILNSLNNKGVWFGEIQNIKKDGTTFWSAANVTVIEHLKYGKAFVSVHTDISELKQTISEKKNLEVQLNQAQKMESIGTLAGGIAHDFNNILSVILGYAEMAKDDCQPGSSISKDLDEVLGAGNRAKDLVQQILAFSRQDDMERKPIQPASIVQEIIQMLRPSLPTTIEITQDIDAVTGLIFVDPSQLNQILMNLCTNAFHAMEDTGGKLAISLKEVTLSNEDLVHEPDVTNGTFIQLSIADSGTGIPPTVKDKVFDPYFTTKEIGKGTGMGLSVVHGIVKNYGGFISLYSELGAGTVFHVFLPIVEQEILTEIKVNDQIPIGRERILFVDDEEILATMGKTMLERLGYHVTVKNSSFEALETFQNHPDQFDIVITDQTMPGMTGADLARRLMQIKPKIPIILCTGYSTIISEEKAKAMGIKEFAFKPLAKKDIAKLIRKLLDVS